MEDLVTSGFVSHDFTWHLKSGKFSKLSHYRLKDNYLRFYLKYIEPYKIKIESGNMKLPNQWQSIMGLQFENLVLSNRKSVHKLLRIDPVSIEISNPFFQRKTKDRLGCQIDYMIQTTFGTCYLCEIKFCSEKISREVVKDVKEKIKNLALPKQMSIRPVLIHCNGVDEDVIESGFFSSIIDFKELLNTQV